jgi:hypothetical protein
MDYLVPSVSSVFSQVLVTSARPLSFFDVEHLLSDLLWFFVVVLIGKQWENSYMPPESTLVQSSPEPLEIYFTSIISEGLFLWWRWPVLSACITVESCLVAVWFQPPFLRANLMLQWLKILSNAYASAI